MKKSGLETKNFRLCLDPLDLKSVYDSTKVSRLVFFFRSNCEFPIKSKTLRHFIQQSVDFPHNNKHARTKNLTRTNIHIRSKKKITKSKM